METTSVEVQQSTEPKSLDWPRIILAAVLGFGLLTASAYAGYWYGTQQVQTGGESTPAVSQPTPTSTPTPTPPVEDGTQGWRTYSSQDLGISFKYPSDYETPFEGTHAMKKECQYIEVWTPDAKKISPPLNRLLISITFCPSKAGDSLEQFAREEKKEHYFNETERSIGGTRAISWQWRTADGDGEVFVLLRDEERITLYKYPLETARQDEFETILSTFKFLE